MLQLVYMPNIILIAHNIRSAHNIGALFRTCDGLGVERIIVSGYSPYPRLPGDARLPHIADKLTAQIHKTALGAEATVPFSYQEHPDFAALRAEGYVIAGLEQDPRSVTLSDYSPPARLALLLGEELGGIPAELRAECDVLLEIPMKGAKESFNVSVAAGIALYALTNCH